MVIHEQYLGSKYDHSHRIENDSILGYFVITSILIAEEVVASLARDWMTNIGDYPSPYSENIIFDCFNSSRLPEADPDRLSIT